MSKHTFTPGPWYVDAYKNVMAQGGLVAFPGIGAGFDQEANARLISAAPELLDALTQWANAERAGDAEELTNARNSRDAAIAKATGGDQ